MEGHHFLHLAGPRLRARIFKIILILLLVVVRLLLLIITISRARNRVPRRWQLLVFWFSAPHHEAHVTAWDGVLSRDGRLAF